MTGWMKAAQSQEESYLKDLTNLLKIPSVRDDSAATDEYPLGPMPAKALQEFLKMAKQDGFRTKNIDNLVNLINSSQLPAFIIESILKDTYKDMSLIAQKQYEKDKADYYKKMQENG